MSNGVDADRGVSTNQIKIGLVAPRGPEDIYDGYMSLWPGSDSWHKDSKKSQILQMKTANCDDEMNDKIASTLQSHLTESYHSTTRIAVKSSRSADRHATGNKNGGVFSRLFKNGLGRMFSGMFFDDTVASGSREKTTVTPSKRGLRAGRSSLEHAASFPDIDDFITVEQFAVREFPASSLRKQSSLDADYEFKPLEMRFASSSGSSVSVDSDRQSSSDPPSPVRTVSICDGSDAKEGASRRYVVADGVVGLVKADICERLRKDDMLFDDGEHYTCLDEISCKRQGWDRYDLKSSDNRFLLLNKDDAFITNGRSSSYDETSGFDRRRQSEEDGCDTTFIDEERHGRPRTSPAVEGVCGISDDHCPIDISYRLEARTPGSLENDAFKRFYHVFRERELVDLIEGNVVGLRIINDYYDHANWCVIAEKC